MRQAASVISYDTDVGRLAASDLTGFFEGWPAAPTAESLLRVLSRSTLAVIARDGDRVVGFVNALSDGELAVYIPLLEVRASHRGRGVGSELVRRVMSRFADTYMIDVICDAELVHFYERLGLRRLAGMAHRNREARVLRSER
jgi:ribosomal protein S18 acetylase RimI-like enzyme